MLVCKSCDPVLLTEADGSQQTQAILWREACGEQRLQDVVGKGQRNHSLVGRVDHQHSDPQTQEPETKRRERVARLQTNRHGRTGRVINRRKYITKKYMVHPYTHVQASISLTLATKCTIFPLTVSTACGMQEVFPCQVPFGSFVKKSQNIP